MGKRKKRRGETRPSVNGHGTSSTDSPGGSIERGEPSPASTDSTTSSRRAQETAPDRSIAAMLLTTMQRERRSHVVDIKNAIAGRAMAEELQRTVASPEELTGFHPAHAAYVFAQNQASVMSEQLTALDEMAPFADLIEEAQELYLPSGPPMSPLTLSYFTCWAFFDAGIGPTNETIGAVILTLGEAFGMADGLLRILGLMQASRMGIYLHEGSGGDGLVRLRELVTGTACQAIVPSACLGRSGELWYARVLPPPIPGGSHHVVFTTPYVLLEPKRPAWEAYFRRVLPDTPDPVRLDAYRQHMKFGPSRNYWNEFVFEGYVNHQSGAIFLAGLPDLPDTRPHSRVNS